MIRSVALFAVLAAGIAAGCDGPEEREAAFLKRGKALFEKGEFVKARLEFKNARQVNPVGVEALYYIGRIAEKLGEIRSAYSAFLMVLEQDPTHGGALLKLGEFYLLAGDVDQALEKADAVIQLDSSQAGGHALRAAALLQRGLLVEAKSETEAALSLDPGNIIATGVLARILRDEGDRDGALAVLARGIKRNPGGLELRLLKARHHAERTEIDAVRALFDEIFDLDSENLAHRVVLAKLYIGWKRFDDAEKLLRNAVDLNPEDNKAKLLLVDFLANRRSVEDAETELTAFIQKAPENHSLRFALADLYRKNELGEQAEKAYLAVIKANGLGPQGLAARVALARLRLTANDGRSADDLIATVLKNEPNYGDALILRARRFLSTGKLQEAITDLRSILRDNPTSRQVLTFLAAAHLRANEPELASNVLQTLVDAYPVAVGARLQLAQLLIAQGAYDVALRHIDLALKLQPQSLVALRLKIGALVTQSKLVEAKKVAKLIADLPNSRLLGLELVARIQLAAANNQEAEQTYLKALELAPQKLELVAGLTRAYVAQQEPEKALSFVGQLIDKNPKNAEILDLAGQLYRSQNNIERAERAFVEATRTKKDWAAPYLNLANLQTAHGNYEGATKTLLQGLQHVQDNTSLTFALAMAYRNTREFDKAAEQFENLLNVPQPIIADTVANNYAAMIAESMFDKPEILQTALDLAIRFDASDNPYFLDTLGWIHYRLGDLDQAQIVLERAVQNGPQISELRYHLGMVYYEKQNLDRARQELSLAVAESTAYVGIDEAKKILKSLRTEDIR